MHAFTLHAPLLPQLPEKFRRLLNATYEAHGGPEHMTLADWRSMEAELKPRLENEQPERPQ